LIVGVSVIGEWRCFAAQFLGGAIGQLGQRRDPGGVVVQRVPHNNVDVTHVADQAVGV
jgi:hypothetical protein